MESKSFFDEYEEKILPVIKELDLLLKAGEFPISVSEASKALNISNDEVFSVLGKLKKEKITKETFFCLMRAGSSDICRLLARELECGSPNIYKPCEIAYIYGLDKQTVEEAFEKLFLSEAAGTHLPAIFTKIPAISS